MVSVVPGHHSYCQTVKLRTLCVMWILQPKRDCVVKQSGLVLEQILTVTIDLVEDTVYCRGYRRLYLFMYNEV